MKNLKLLIAAIITVLTISACTKNNDSTSTTDSKIKAIIENSTLNKRAC